MTEAAEIMRARIRRMWPVTSSSSRGKGAFGRIERQQDERGEKPSPFETQLVVHLWTLVPQGSAKAGGELKRDSMFLGSVRAS